ncbi:armadillo repeat protein deleted in velo-cardio-facial syndrome-like protein [Leptotrombidium deliense]|uniref:Armadillo repeat protein deleted in velo-cardio-facial syndrome-like protein n=1 Tax=Leptotrombidium deliense TaxID=299467 RepID=A0A443SQ77_9ACAR|nr:armadillo repeat protein deleted in velo-cardio-facial syndrome-like protein [Leptotrombidium deliense]
MDYHNYQEYPITSTTPSMTSESPTSMRRGSLIHNTNSAIAQPNFDDLDPSLAYRNSGAVLPQSGYDELDVTLQFPQYQQHSPYGYTTGAHHAPNAFNPYEHQPPQGYLDRRQSYDDHNTYQSGALIAHQSRGAFEDQENGLRTVPQGLLAETASEVSGDSVRWRDPDLHEVIEFLGHPNSLIRANAAAYLQHLCFMDDGMKQKARALGSIPALINLLNQEIPEVEKNACGALRNLSYGRQNDENKKAIRNAGGIASLVRLLRKTTDSELKELVTGILWNLSSCEDLKRAILDEALTVLVNHIMIPQSGWDRNNIVAESAYGGTNGSGHSEMYWSTVFRNASGVLRNISSAGDYARKKLRECDGLVDSLLYLVRTAIGKSDVDNKSIENCVCVLRNLSYRCQEVIDPEYDKHFVNHQNDSSLSPSSSRAAAIMGSVGSKVGDNLGCFGGSKKKKDTPITPTEQHQPLTGNSTTTPTIPSRPRLEPVRGMELLWQPEVVQPYLALLSECSNPETLEAAAGAIQNLSACYWQPSVDIRAAVRKEKGLPILVELLRMEVDRVVCAVATALRNLAMDQRNKELIGKYAMRDLVSKLPNGNQQHDGGTSDDTIAAVLATLNEVISNNADFAKSLVEADGMERLLFIIKNKQKFSPRVFKFTSQLLFNMWQHVELREVYRKAGYKESHFLVRPMITRNSSGGNILQSPTSANNTLSRPMSTQGGTKYEDRTLPRGGGAMLQMNRPEELPLSDVGQVGRVPDGVISPGHQRHRPPVGGVAIYPPGVTYIHGPLSEPVYAQVNRERKKGTQRGTDSSSTQALLGSENNYAYDPNNEPIYHPSMPAGDSWV